MIALVILFAIFVRIDKSANYTGPIGSTGSTGIAPIGSTGSTGVSLNLEDAINSGGLRIDK